MMRRSDTILAYLWLVIILIGALFFVYTWDGAMTKIAQKHQQQEEVLDGKIYDIQR